MNRFLFSIIVPIYNVEKYLEDCLNSIINQTYIYDYEVILINDGSTDNSYNIINNYKEKLKNCRIINRENRGLLYSRVEGVKNSNGEYIIFVDSDDFLPEKALELYSKYIEEYRYDIIRGNYYKFNKENTEEVVEFLNTYIIEDKDIVVKFYKELLTSSKFNHVWKQAIKKDIIHTDEINTSITMGEDIEFNQACYKYAKRIKIIIDRVYYYRKNDLSITNDYSVERLQKNILDISKVYETIIENIKRYNDEFLLKLGYSSFLRVINAYYYKLVKSCNDNEILKKVYDKIRNNHNIIEARQLLTYKEIHFKKIRLLLYVLLLDKRKIYFFLLKVLNFLGVKKQEKLKS